jgi:hypothetical protein
LATSLSLVSASNAISLTFNSQFGTTGTGNGQFNGLPGITSDSSGNIFVADDNLRVQKFNSSGVYQSQFGSSGTGNGQFNNSITGLAINSSGNIFVADSPFGNRTQQFDNNGTFLSSFSLGSVQSIAIDSSNNIFTGTTGGVTKYDGSLNPLFTIGSFGTGNGEVANVSSIAFDASGNIFVADSGNWRVQKFNSAGVYQSQFGSRGNGNGQFERVSGIALDASGNIFATDTGNSRIQVFDSSGNYLTQVSGVGTAGGAGSYLTIFNNKLYSTDYYNNRVQVYDINATPVPFDFSPNFGVGILGAVFVTKKLIKKKVVKEKVDALRLMMKQGK